MPLLAAAFVWRTRTAPEKGGPVNTYVNDDMATAIAAVEEILAGGGKRGRVPELWDGHASERIATHLTSWLAQRVESVFA